MLLGEPEQLAADLAQVAQEQRVRALDLQHGAGVEHVLRGRAEMQVFAVVADAHRLQRPQRRHKGMLDAAHLGGDRFQIDVADFGLAGDLVGRGLWNDAEFGLRQRQRRFVVEPGLKTRLVIEDRA